MLCSSALIIHSVSGLCVPFVKELSISSTLLACEKSLIYIINKRGPSIEPCGKHGFIGKTFDFMSSIYINCSLFVK